MVIASGTGKGPGERMTGSVPRLGWQMETKHNQYSPRAQRWPFFPHKCVEGNNEIRAMPDESHKRWAQTFISQCIHLTFPNTRRLPAQFSPHAHSEGSCVMLSVYQDTWYIQCIFKSWHCDHVLAHFCASNWPVPEKGLLSKLGANLFWL